MHGSQCAGQSSEQDRVLIKLGYAERQTNNLASEYILCQRLITVKEENKAGERIGVTPPSGGAKSGNARLGLRGNYGESPDIQNFCRKFG